MIGYLVDTSALWRLFRDDKIFSTWQPEIDAAALSICEATRAELLFSATGPTDRDEIAADLDTVFGLATVPKSVWRWVDTAQYKLTQRGQHRSAGVVDLVVCATAVHHGLTVLHADADFATVARVLPELQERDIRDSS
ncbi:PIN domain nuclease [Nocardia sp. CDC153]|uniref:PIN domain nuclease n=1 Tax=Nocardia sp. CDC153 TaxID=3112167 RepID=UPI002DB89327|nr:PIN domain nuclease [Nocardia sp. CDC153]MEC3957299.1 PIN domain nuclease [Nocardia sp. CDC153]